jgi:Flp pilus assembly protein TadB
VAVVHTLVLLVALLALLFLPCVVAAVICADEILDRIAWAFAQRREARRERRVMADLEEALDGAMAAHRDALEAFEEAGQPAIQQVAADLRRLGSLRLGVATTSPVWHAAILRAYDDRLRLACQYLGVAEHLAQLGGVDLEIERVRVEGELLGLGLILGGSRRAA